MLLAIPTGQFHMFCRISSQTQSTPLRVPASSCQFAARKPAIAGKFGPASTQFAWPIFAKKQKMPEKPAVARPGQCIRLRLGFAGFVDIADRRFIDEQMRRAAAVQLDAIAVVPL